MSKKKVCVVIFSRANYGSIKSVLLQIQKSKKLDLQIILGGSVLVDKYGSTIDLIKKDGFKIYHQISFLVEGETNLTMTKTTGLAILEISTSLDNLKPDILLTVGDRYETMATVIAAAYMNIPIAHTMGGEISGTIDESIRHAITKFSHIHFPATAKAKNNIIRLGEDKRYVFNVGCPRIDLVKNVLQKRIDLEQKVFANGVGNKFNLEKEKYMCIMHYPVTTEYKMAGEQILTTLKAISSFKHPKIIFWPNSDAGSDKFSSVIRMWRELKKPNDMWFVKNLDHETFYHLLNNSLCLIGNSSTGIREGSFIGVPFVNIGSRQNKRESGYNTTNVSYNKNDIIKGIKYIIKKKRVKSTLYGNGNAGKKIVKILEKINLKKLNIQKTLKY